MKHSISITAILIALFLAAQIIGLSLLSLNIDNITTEDGKVVVEHGTTALGERPQTTGYQSLLYLLVGVAIGTALVLVLIKFKIFGIWKLWFLFAVWFSTSIAVGVLIPPLIAIIICLGFAIWKVYWPNPVVHNISEIFMYAGLAVLLVPIFTIGWVCILLLIISAYDIIAVWYSKHMVVMAQAQTQSNLFAGLYLPKSSKSSTHIPPPTPAGKKSSGGAAILGGGDIAFPLLFAGVVMDWLIMQGMGKVDALLLSLVVPVITAVALGLLFFYAKKDKFYPAMPFLSAGVFVGFGIVLLLRMF